MRFLSVCSGIEAASVAWRPLGWSAVAYSEIEPFPCAVLAHHYPNTPNLGDMTKFKEWPDADVDLLCGGTPCQSFSVAGLRKGLDDQRGDLMLTYLAIAGRYRPKWLVWENVPGVLSSNNGKDFGAFLGGLAELGYGFAYRILDAQYFGVAQRRRRVFVVGCLGDWRAAAAVLFERDGLQGNPAPSREKGQAVAGTLASRTEGGGFPGTDEACSGYIQPVAIHGYRMIAFGEYAEDGRASTMKARDYKNATDLVAIAIHAEATPTLTSNGDAHSGFRDERGLIVCAAHLNPVFALQHAQIGRKSEAGPQGKGWQSDVSFTLDSRHEADAVAYSAAIGCFKGGQGAAAGGIGYDEHVSPTLSAADSGSNRAPTLMQGMSVRRLTPVECERLQGFPDEYTNIKFKGKQVGDGHRYKAIGNSWAVPCARWIGKRIDAVESIRIQA